MDTNEYLNVNEAASFLKIKSGTLYNWVDHNKIPFKKANGRLLFSKAELIEFIENSK